MNTIYITEHVGTTYTRLLIIATEASNEALGSDVRVLTYCQRLMDNSHVGVIEALPCTPELLDQKNRVLSRLHSHMIINISHTIICRVLFYVPSLSSTDLL